MNEEFKWITGHCFLGKILIAVSDKGLCAIMFSDRIEEMTDDLSKRFPTVILKQDEGIRFVLDKVIAFVENPLSKIDFTLDERGTLFQKEVWRLLREIPVGEVSTYKALAEKLGNPKATRAVGTACGANPLAVVTPCHRVNNAKGGLSGFRWGVERKKRLQELERIV